MKDYRPEKLVSISRYQNYFPALNEEIKQDVYQRMNELIKEENEYCDKGNYSHMAQILTSIALYEVLQKHGKSEEEAYRIVSEEMWKFLDPSSMKKLAKRSFFLPLMKKIVLRKDQDTAGVIPGIRMILRMNFVLNAMNAYMPRYLGKEI